MPRNQQGFTLVELLIVVAILAILAVLIFPSLRLASIKDSMRAEIERLTDESCNGSLYDAKPLSGAFQCTLFVEDDPNGDNIRQSRELRYYAQSDHPEDGSPITVIGNPELIAIRFSDGKIAFGH